MCPIAVREDEIVQEVVIHSPAERIFRALTRPQELLRWWAAEGRFQLIEAQCDLQPGGKWRMRVAGRCTAESAVSTVYGEYRDVEPPCLLTYTWTREPEDWPETLVRWDLKEVNGCTTVRVTHSGLVSEALRHRNSGWPVVLKLLERFVVLSS
ncbi:MAG TPA: SRPBCC domain-containing protein [Terracidiphilus sp.]|jgi:uncharacterized protein YndB with AHSA1/START domain